MSKNKFHRFGDSVASYLWGEKFSPWYLIIASLFIMLFMLGGRDLWTQESRWANISQQMMQRHNYFHPYLGIDDYYDKPLLTYWFIIGCSYIFKFGIWALRIPGIIAGLLTVWATYKVGLIISDKKVGIIAAWMTVTTLMFVYWARVASADIWNVAGIMLAVAWILARKDKPNYLTHVVFFVLVAFSALLKGLIAPSMIVMILLPMGLYKNYWIKHLKWSVLVSIIIGLIIYFTPFAISAYFDHMTGYTQSGLWEVFNENINRYFRPFDHKGPVYTYFVFLPLYTAPWILFSIVGFFYTIFNWRKLEWAPKYYVLATVLSFIFLTCSGSRRDYYVLPMIPFTILIGADWLRRGIDTNKLRNTYGGLLATFAIVVLIIAEIVLSVGDLGGGIRDFAFKVRSEASQIQPWQDWKVSYAGVKPKASWNASFYMDIKQLPDFINMKLSDNMTEQAYVKEFPFKISPASDTIIIVQESYLKFLKNQLPKDKYKIVLTRETFSHRLFHKRKEKYLLAAIIPLDPVKGSKLERTVSPVISKTLSPVIPKDVDTNKDKTTLAPLAKPGVQPISDQKAIKKEIPDIIKAVQKDNKVSTKTVAKPVTEQSALVQKINEADKIEDNSKVNQIYDATIEAKEKKKSAIKTLSTNTQVDIDKNSQKESVPTKINEVNPVPSNQNVVKSPTTKQRDKLYSDSINSSSSSSATNNN